MLHKNNFFWKVYNAKHECIAFCLDMIEAARVAQVVGGYKRCNFHNTPEFYK